MDDFVDFENLLALPQFLPMDDTTNMWTQNTSSQSPSLPTNPTSWRNTSDTNATFYSQMHTTPAQSSPWSKSHIAHSFQEISQRDTASLPQMQPVGLRHPQSDTALNDPWFASDTFASDTNGHPMQITGDTDMANQTGLSHDELSAYNMKGKQPVYPSLEPQMDVSYTLPGNDTVKVAPTFMDVQSFLTSYDVQLDTLLKYFQVLDTFKHHYRYTAIVPSSVHFDFDADMQYFARVVQSWLVTVAATDGSLNAIQPLEAYRPQGPTLPAIPAIPVASTTVKAQEDVTTPGSNQQPQLPDLRSLMAYIHDPQDPNLLFFDHDHSLTLRQEYQGWNNQVGEMHKPTAPSDIPQVNTDAYRTYVKRLYTAMMDFSICIEKDKKEVRGPKRKLPDGTKIPGILKGHEDALQAKRVQKAPRIVLELAACEILDAAIEAHKGNVWINNWDEQTGWRYEDHPTFEARFTHLEGALLHSKAIIDNVMKFSVLRRFAAAPAKEYGRKFNNHLINLKRDQQVKAGIHAIQAGSIQVDANLALHTANGQILHQPAPAPAIPKPVTVGRAKKMAKGAEGQGRPTA